MNRFSIGQPARRVLRAAWLMVLFAMLQGSPIVQAGTLDNNTSLDQLAFQMRNPSWTPTSGIAGTTPAMVVDQPVKKSWIPSWFRSGQDKFKSVCSSAATAIGNKTIMVLDKARDMYGSAKAMAGDAVNAVVQTTKDVVDNFIPATGQVLGMYGEMLKDGANLLLEAGKGLDFLVQAGLPAGIRALKGEDVVYQGPNEDACMDKQMLDLADSSYTKDDLRTAFNDEGKSMNDEWTRVDDPDVKQANNSWWGLGFHAELYKSSDGKHQVLAFRGTEPDSIIDWINDLILNPLGLSPQYVEAAALAGELAGKLKGDTELTLTGHSLGGGMAQYAAAAMNLKAVTFNAASPATTNLLGVAITGVSDSKSRNTVNYRHISDPISMINEVTDLSITKTIGEDRILDGNEIGFVAHKLEPLRNVLIKQCKPENQVLLPPTSTPIHIGQNPSSAGDDSGDVSRSITSRPPITQPSKDPAGVSISTTKTTGTGAGAGGGSISPTGRDPRTLPFSK